MDAPCTTDASLYFFFCKAQGFTNGNKSDKFEYCQSEVSKLFITINSAYIMNDASSVGKQTLRYSNVLYQNKTFQCTVLKNNFSGKWKYIICF